ncbi:hypothetical protein EBT31_22035 [bacterium]|nr:hypothetical protein [bacterium]
MAGTIQSTHYTVCITDYGKSTGTKTLNRPKDKASYLLHWTDDVQPNLGEGISRTSSNRAKLHELLVKQGQTPPMREWIRAETKKEALRFASNRYPTATSITYITQVNDTTTSRRRVSNRGSADQTPSQQ